MVFRLPFAKQGKKQQCIKTFVFGFVSSLFGNCVSFVKLTVLSIGKIFDPFVAIEGHVLSVQMTLNQGEFVPSLNFAIEMKKNNKLIFLEK